MSRPSITSVLLDMGGVLLDMGNAAGMPVGALDWRGREALLREISERGGRCSLEELGSWLFGPWLQAYASRYEHRREAPVEPHLTRLRHEAGFRAWNRSLLRVWFRPYGEQVRPVPGAGEALRELRGQGFRLGLVSNVPLPGELYESLLSRHGLREPFEVLCFSYDEGVRKPSPALPRRALVALGAQPAEAVMVGDRRDADVTAGRLAGTRTVWVRSERRDGPEPDAVIGSVAELPELLGRWR